MQKNNNLFIKNDSFGDRSAVFLYKIVVKLLKTKRRLL